MVFATCGVHATRMCEDLAGNNDAPLAITARGQDLFRYADMVVGHSFTIGKILPER